MRRKIRNMITDKELTNSKLISNFVKAFNFFSLPFLTQLLEKSYRNLRKNIIFNKLYNYNVIVWL